MASGKSSFIFFRIRARVVQSVKYDDTLEDTNTAQSACRCLDCCEGHLEVTILEMLYRDGMYGS